MLLHITKSKEAKQFFKDCGLTLTKDSSHNASTLRNKNTGRELQLWAESGGELWNE